jgi:hypothetical protein
MNHTTIQSALQTCVTAASQLPSAQVLWAWQAYQGGERPTGRQFITLQLGPYVPVGLDYVTDSTDLTRPAGSEIKFEAVMPREVNLYLQCFGGTPSGSGSAFATLTRLRDRLLLPSVRAALLAAGVSPFNPGTVRHLPFIEGTKLESRAALDINCYVNASESETAGFIDHVSITDKISTPNYTFTVDCSTSA